MDKPSANLLLWMSFIQLIAQMKLGVLDTAYFYLEALFLQTRKVAHISI